MLFRSATLEELKTAGWTGPTSYTATILRDTLLPWVKAGCPQGDESIPAGAMNHVYPPTRADRSPRRSKAYESGYLDALKEVGGQVQSKNASVAALRKWLLAEVDRLDQASTEVVA